MEASENIVLDEEESAIVDISHADDPSVNNTILHQLQKKPSRPSSEVDQEDEPIEDSSDDEGVRMHRQAQGSVHASDESEGLVSDNDSNRDSEVMDGDSDYQDQHQVEPELPAFFEPAEKKLKQWTLRVKPQQEELFKNSLDRNSIIYLPTGCGKTLVSILAMHYYFIKYGFEKKVVFLANTIQLVKQQAAAIKKHLPKISQNQAMMRLMNSRCSRPYAVEFTEDNVKDYVVCLHGEKNEQVGMTQRRLIETNIRDRRQLMNKIQNAKIVVMIAQMFLNCLRRGYTKLHDYVLVVFDECHHCQGDHPFGSIMREFYFEQLKKQQEKVQNGQEIQFQQRLPLIMGLTASPVDSVYFQPERLTKAIEKLCINLDSDYVYYDYRKHNQDKKECGQIEVKEVCEKDTAIDELLVFFETIQSHRNPLQASLEKMKTYFPLVHELITEMNSLILNQERVLSPPVKDLFYELQRSLLVRAANIWLQLGHYAYFLVLEDLTSEFNNLRPRKDIDVKEQVDAMLVRYLARMRIQYGKCVESNMSAKFMKLYEIIRKEVDSAAEKQTQMRILVFAFQRRIVKYLQRVFNDFVDKLPPEEKIKFISESVCGVSAARNIRYDNTFEHEYEDPSDLDRQRKDARTRQVEYENEIRNHRGGLNDSMNNSIRNEQQKYDNSKLARLMLEPEEKYDSQIQAIRGFRAKTIPILFTTSVTEEGFDIPHCNMVVSFDRPQSLKSFIQIKGRARQASSKYVILVNSLEYPKMEKDNQLYQATIELTEQFAIEKMAKRVGNEKSGVKKPAYTRDETYKVTGIRGSGAIINTNNAIEILKSYINTLRGTGEPSQKIFEYYAGTSTTGFICHLVIPGGGLDIVSGDLQKTKKAAARSAAFNAVKELRKLGQIREDLRPKNEAELTEERDLQKFNDLQLVRNDPDYAEIFKNYVRIQINKEKGTERLFYHSLSSADFDFHKINPEFAMAVSKATFKDTPYNFQLYRIALTNVDPQVRENKVNSEMKGVEVGILTCFRQEHVKEVFSGFRYQLKKDSGQYYSLELVDEALPLTQEQFERLWRIHAFMMCSVASQDIRYFANFLHHQNVSVPAWRTKINEPKFNYEIDQGRKFHPLFVLLHRHQKKFSLAEELNQRMLEYEKVLGEIYCFHNKFKETGQKGKLPHSAAKYVEEHMMSFCRDYQEPTYKNNFILQSITSDFLLNKVVVMSRENIGRDASNLKGRVYEQKARNKAKEMDYQGRHEQLKRIFEHSGSNFDCLITCSMLRKRLKQLNQEYLARDDGLTKVEEQPTQFKFLSEFVSYPLDLETVFTVLLAREYVMPKVIDYTRAYFFRNKRLVEIEKEGFFKAQTGHRTYTLTSSRNLIDRNYDNLTVLLLEHNSPWMKELGRAFDKGFNSQYIWPLKHIQQEIETRKLTPIDPSKRICKEDPASRKELVCEQININEVLRSITSRIYKSNKHENYEEYEFIGDCVLKLLATIEAFVEEPKHEEGELHLARARVISNSNLHVKSIKKLLFQFILTTPSEEPAPPFRFKPLPLNKDIQEEYKDTGIKLMDERGALDGYFYIPGKYHADVIEALVGIYYMQSNRSLDNCQFLLYSLDVLRYPSIQFNYTFEEVAQQRPLFKQFERRLQYTFNNKNLIYQACTHSSFESVLTSCVNKELAELRNELERNASNIEDITQIYSERYSNKIVTSKIEKHELFYERLEFLGDSVLDLVAVEYIHEKHKNLDEGLYSLLKQASVSNRTLGLVALYWGLDEFIMIDSRESKDAFADIKKRFEHYYNTPEEIYTSELAPLKVLGDIFEACIGAVFLDTKFDYGYTRRICQRLMLPFIDHFTSDDMIKHYPQYKMIEYLKNNSFEGVRVVKDCSQPPINGEYEYVLMDKSNNIINKCREQTEKKAWDKLIETYQQQLIEQE